MHLNLFFVAAAAILAVTTTIQASAAVNAVADAARQDMTTIEKANPSMDLKSGTGKHVHAELSKRKVASYTVRQRTEKIGTQEGTKGSTLSGEKQKRSPPGRVIQGAAGSLRAKTKNLFGGQKKSSLVPIPPKRSLQRKRSSVQSDAA
ncbi:uncharacterized protein BYT42DRAFT_630337 [Radiomyces spectabilis]|uniref:uncharacterized protein n=1 Tax=Radiomyces spectabilis TaxID=64574 RepID=UPI002220FC6A|nr:uncharacterized protein BYT42DRAFT_630337 [Radiomyces spectabilis]KAI8387959.1 hypothetical protein BYT42DRAFT_630337 [Radiomyces spectabilis]